MIGLEVGKYVELTIGQKKPIIQTNDTGLKTVFVRPRINWPAPTGQTYPSVPSDMEIQIRNTVGATYIDDFIALPVLGAAFEITGDQIEVFANYSTKQALVTPYAKYEIEAGIINGANPLTTSNYFFYSAVENAHDVTYPTSGYYTIPPYSTEFRITTNNHGIIALYSPDVTLSYERFDLQYCEQWMKLSPDKYQYIITVRHPGEGNYVQTSIEFR